MIEAMSKKWVIETLVPKWMRGYSDETTRDWLRTAMLYDERRDHMISITSMMKNLMMNLIIWLMIVSGLIVDDIRRWYDYLDDAVDAIICCTRHWYEYMYWVCFLSTMGMLAIYTIYVSNALAIDLRFIYDRSYAI